MAALTLRGISHVPGVAAGKLIGSDVALSFWGGVDPTTSEVIDRHHPLSGRLIEDAILAIPGGRGSCSGSGIMLELLLNGKSPKALIFARQEDILTLGVMISEELFAKTIPVVVVGETDFEVVLGATHVQVENNIVTCTYSVTATNLSRTIPGSVSVMDHGVNVQLSVSDKAMLSGSHGEAARIAMRIVLRMARLLGATQLLNVTQVHIDGCVYTGQASLAFAEKLRDLGGKVQVPTTLNSISVDQKRWRAQGVEPTFGNAAERLGLAYTEMGALPTFTCAPYLLKTTPRQGEQIAWAESNAVVYANSVLGARTMKYPDFLDIAIALTGRAPFAGLHVPENRKPALLISAAFTLKANIPDDSFWPLLGYACGQLAGNRIPAVVGMQNQRPTVDDLKGFGAAFATVASAPMFHIAEITPEASASEMVEYQRDGLPIEEIDMEHLKLCWHALNTALSGQRVQLVSLGNPHFSMVEIRKLAHLCKGRTKCKDVAVVVTCGRSTHGLASQAGLIEELEDFGVQFVTDTCWCMITYEPIIAKAPVIIMTNSAKYAHYGPGLTGKLFYFGSLTDCVETACQGYRFTKGLSSWHGSKDSGYMQDE